MSFSCSLSLSRMEELKGTKKASKQKCFFRRIHNIYLMKHGTGNLIEQVIFLNFSPKYYFLVLEDYLWLYFNKDKSK